MTPPLLQSGRKRPTVIALYCHEYGNAWFPNWGPSSLGKGLGGSEEVVVHIARGLARLGYWVEVYADPIGTDVGMDFGGEQSKTVGGRRREVLKAGQREEGGLGEGGVWSNRGGEEPSGGVVWYPYKAYDVSNPPDVFVAWR